METIPTAEEFLLSNANGTSLKSLSQCLIEFAKLHKNAALKEAADKGTTEEVGRGFFAKTVVNPKSILNVYPDENIK